MTVQASALLNGESFAETLARRFHDEYEAAAPLFGYATRRESAVPWEQVPEANRRLMVHVCERIAEDLLRHATESLTRQMKAVAGAGEPSRLSSFLDAVRDMPEVRSVQVVGHEDDGEERAE